MISQQMENMERHGVPACCSALLTFGALRRLLVLLGSPARLTHSRPACQHFVLVQGPSFHSLSSLCLSPGASGKRVLLVVVVVGAHFVT